MPPIAHQEGKAFTFVSDVRGPGIQSLVDGQRGVLGVLVERLRQPEWWRITERLGSSCGGVLMFYHSGWLPWHIRGDLSPAGGAGQSRSLGILGTAWLASAVWAPVSLTTAHQSAPEASADRARQAPEPD